MRQFYLEYKDNLKLQRLVALIPLGTKCRITKILPKAFKDKLPTVEVLEAELTKEIFNSDGDI